MLSIINICKTEQLLIESDSEDSNNDTQDLSSDLKELSEESTS